MKEAGTLHWSTPNTGADNNSGFTALPAGDRSGGGFSFNNFGTWCYFWSTTVNSSEDAFGREINNTAPGIGNYPYDKRFGFSVRCIKN
ncbi:MAG: hypothetical protein C0408_00700 [Odoribacter sp.]|nr:hypothetical protein [Odoribacter sp.]